MTQRRNRIQQRNKQILPERFRPFKLRGARIKVVLQVTLGSTPNRQLVNFRQSNVAPVPQSSKGKYFEIFKNSFGAIRHILMLVCIKAVVSSFGNKLTDSFR